MRFIKLFCCTSLFFLTTIAKAELIDFAYADRFTMAAAGSDSWQGNLLLGSEAHIFGHVAASATLELGDGVQVDGDACAGLVRDWGAMVSGALGGCSDTQLLADSIQSAAAQAGAVASTLRGDINASTVIDAAAENALTFSSLVLAGGEILTLTGTAFDSIIINVLGEAKLGSGAAIQLTGGLRAANVVFNFIANPSAHSFEIGAAEISGTFLSVGRSFILGDGATLNNTRFYSSESIIANVQDVRYPHVTKEEKSVVSEPSSLALFALVLAGLISWRRQSRSFAN